MSTAFVLTGGGSLGAVQVGMLAALHEHGIEPDLLVGTSAGALNAAYLAGPGTTGRPDRLAGRTCGSDMRRRDVFVAQPRRWLAATIGAAPSMFPATPLRALVAAPPRLRPRSRTPACRCTSWPPTSSPVRAWP